MMPRTIGTGLAMALWAGAAAAQAPGFAGDGTMAACTTAAFPPLTYKEAPGDERPVGIDVDVIEEVARRLGSEVEYVTTDFAGLLPSLGSGRCDVIISGIYINDERRETYDGARYMTSATVIVTAGDDETVEAPEDLSGRTLALESGTYYGEERVEPLNAALEAEGRAPVEVQQYPSQQDATQQVMIGRADATLTEEAEGAWRVERSDGGLRIAHVFPSDFTYGIYIRPDEAGIVVLRETLKAMSTDGFFDEVAAEYGLDPGVFDVDFDD